MKNDIKKTQHPNSIKCLIYKRKTAPVIGAVNYGGGLRLKLQLRILEPPDHTKKLPHFRRKCNPLICTVHFSCF